MMVKQGIPNFIHIAGIIYCCKTIYIYILLCINLNLYRTFFLLNIAAIYHLNINKLLLKIKKNYILHLKNGTIFLKSIFDH